GVGVVPSAAAARTRRGELTPRARDVRRRPGQWHLRGGGHPRVELHQRGPHDRPLAHAARALDAARGRDVRRGPWNRGRVRTAVGPRRTVRALRADADLRAAALTLPDARSRGAAWLRREVESLQGGEAAVDPFLAPDELRVVSDLDDAALVDDDH